MLLTESIGTDWAWVIPALCASAFFIIFPLRVITPRLAAAVSILAIFSGFLLFWCVLDGLLSSGTAALSMNWMVVGETVLTWGIVVDPLSVTMLGLVTFVALLVQVYSLAYMTHNGVRDKGFGRYFAFHSLFAAAMLALVLADNLLFLYIAWELVGLGSYLLIGFWYERKPAAEAAKKAFVTTRIGDVGLLIGIIMLFTVTGTFDISTIIHIAQQPEGISPVTLNVSVFLIFLGAMGKSAQFPFHIWLPDAMEGPTPVSALIHAATMVAAGVYLVARLLPLYEIAHSVMLIVASVGLFTFIFAGTLALVMNDIKRVLAYSTISHLGLMMLALGAGGLGAAIFHLVAHGVAKALLFLGAGSVMHSMDEETDVRKMGGLRHRLPITSWTFVIGAASLAGIIPFAGFFSKDEVLLHVLNHRNPVFITTSLLAVTLSALYMARLTFLVFFGSLKTVNRTIIESPLVMTLPLLLLAFCSISVGFLVFNYFEGYPGIVGFLDGHGEFAFAFWLTIISLSLASSGVLLGWLIYGKGRIASLELTSHFKLLHKILMNKYYIDFAIQWSIDKLVLAAGRCVSAFDRVVINDTGVDGSAITVWLSARTVRKVQTGKFYNYGLMMSLGVLSLGLIVWLTQKLSNP